MNDQSEKIIIAEACGWSVSKDGLLTWYNKKPAPFDGDSLNDFNSLDAMQKAVLMQDEEFQKHFTINLLKRGGWWINKDERVPRFILMPVIDWRSAFVETLKQLGRIK